MILTAISATLALVTVGWVALLFESADFTLAVAGTIACGKSGTKNASWCNAFGYQKLKAYATGLLTAGMIAWH